MSVIVRLAKERGLESAGAFSTNVHYSAVANSLGIFAYEPRTDAECHAVIMADERGSGYTQRMSTDASTLDFGRYAAKSCLYGPLCPGCAGGAQLYERAVRQATGQPAGHSL